MGNALAAQTDTIVVARPRAHARPAGAVIWLICKVMGGLVFVAHHPWLGAAIFFAPDPWMFCQIALPSSRGFGTVVTHFQTTKREVWLTIDDGPDPKSTPQVLDALDEFGARATFFVIGKKAAAHPELLRQIVQRGHGLANHSHSHPAASFWCAGPWRSAEEIDACENVFRDAKVESLPYFRPPVGLKNAFLHVALKRRGIACVAWSARGFDRILKLNTAVARIGRRIRPGAIVLLHDGGACDAQLIRRVLQELRTREFQAVIPPPHALVGD